MYICDCISDYFCFFFFQAEDGIRDYKVTGVQTCALPICIGSSRAPLIHSSSFITRMSFSQWLMALSTRSEPSAAPPAMLSGRSLSEIGRVTWSFIGSLPGSVTAVAGTDRPQGLRTSVSAYDRYAAGPLGCVNALTQHVTATALSPVGRVRHWLKACIQAEDPPDDLRALLLAWHPGTG